MSARCTVLACGDASRGDDGAAIAAMDRLAAVRRPGVRVRVVGQLEPDDIVEALLVGRCIVVDAVHGVEPGTVVEIPLRALGGSDGPQPASSHALPIEIVVGLAEALGANLDDGTFVGIGGRCFEIGSPLSEPVATAIGDLALAIDRQIGMTPLAEASTEEVRPCA
jgi:hydrogenase maturation protease